MPNKYWVVLTDFDPQTLTQVGLRVYEQWVSFAMGRTQLQSRQLQHPTGRYASAISRQPKGPYRVAIIADEQKAPEALFLEEGHDPVDLKKKLTGGRAYPIYRGSKTGTSGGGYHWSGGGYGPPVRNPSQKAFKRNIWGVVRSSGNTGIARVPTKITPQNAHSWIIPRMVAYSPAAHLVDLLKKRAFG